MDKILEKIKKLLALAASSNEHEAKAAAEAANRLLVKHNLTMQQTKEKSEIKTHKTGHKTIYGTPHQRFISSLLINFFFVRVFRQPTVVGTTVDGRRKIEWETIIVGRNVNVQVAIYVQDFLAAQFPKLWLAFKHEHDASEKSRKSYYHGLYVGLCAQLETTKTDVEQQTGLVIVPDADITNFMTQLQLKSAKAARETHFDGSAFINGQEDGKNLRLNRAVNEQSTVRNVMIGNKNM